MNRMRDKKTNAILNTDVAALNKYKQDRALHRKVETLSQEVQEIRALITSVAQRLEKLENT